MDMLGYYKAAISQLKKNFSQLQGKGADLDEKDVKTLKQIMDLLAEYSEKTLQLSKSQEEQLFDKLSPDAQARIQKVIDEELEKVKN
jgi:hypothetical protein